MNLKLFSLTDISHKLDLTWKWLNITYSSRETLHIHKLNYQPTNNYRFEQQRHSNVLSNGRNLDLMISGKKSRFQPSAVDTNSLIRRGNDYSRWSFSLITYLRISLVIRPQSFVMSVTNDFLINIYGLLMFFSQSSKVERRFMVIESMMQIIIRQSRKTMDFNQNEDDMRIEISRSIIFPLIENPFSTEFAHCSTWL